jgi:hypothetical protein
MRRAVPHHQHCPKEIEEREIGQVNVSEVFPIAYKEQRSNSRLHGDGKHKLCQINERIVDSRIGPIDQPNSIIEAKDVIWVEITVDQAYGTVNYAKR